LKSEPSTYSWDDLTRDKKTRWDGVRNFEARNNLRAMKKGDLCLFYHSGDGKEVVGVAKVTVEAYPDPATEEDWSAVDVAPVKALATPVTLSKIKTSTPLKNMVIVKKSRLSVSPVTEAEFASVLKESGTKL
jgi:predicted RNA-binding protein with PUA-like domain